MDKVDLPQGPNAFSSGELERAGRMASASLRRRFLARRWMARSLLGMATGQQPAELVLERRCERCGRPHPVSPLRAGASELWWSASSSGGVAALAVAPFRVGLDLEVRRERPRWQRIASRFFNAEEQRALAGSGSRFLEFWTLKEAYLKAHGVGLPGGLDALDCSDLQPRPDGWSSSGAQPGWRFRNLVPQPDLVAALAVAGEPGRIQLRRWP